MKNKIIILFLSTLFTTVNTFSQIKTFIKTVHETGAQQFFDAERTYDNGIIIIGQAGEGYCGAGLLTKIDSCGELVWAKTFGETGKYPDGGRVIQEMPNHNLLLGGFVVQGTSRIGVLKLADEFGVLIWSVMFNNLRFITGVNKTINGDILVCGYTHNEQCAYIKLDANGNVIWKKTMNVVSPSKRGYNIMEISTGDYILIWNTITPKADVYISLMNPLGEIQWTKSYGTGSAFPILREWEPSAVIDPNDGNIVVCTATTSLGQGTETAPDILTFKIDLTGNVMWAKTYGNTSDDQPKKIAYDVQTEGFLISGKTDFDVSAAPTTEVMTGHNAMVISIDNTGATLRTNIYGGNGEDKAIETVSYDNHYITSMVSLNSLGSAGYDPFIIKTNEIGEVACQHTTINFSAAFATLSASSHAITEVSSSLPAHFGGSGFTDDGTTFTIHCQSCDPYFEMIGSPTICLEDSIVLIKKDGCQSFFTINGQVEAQDTVVFKYTDGGEHTISVEHNCIENPFEYHVFVSVPKAAFTWDNKCLYDSIPFQDQSIVNYGIIDQWNWDFGENNTSSSLQNPKHLYQNDGDHTVKLIVTTDGDCTDTLDHEITAYPIPTAILLTKPECLYDSLQFKDSTLLNSPSNISTYITSFGDGSPIVQEQNPKHKYTTAGTYNVSYITVTNQGCVDDTNITVAVYPIPIALFSSTTVCENVPPTEFSNLSTVSSGSVIDWQWDFDENQENISTLPNPSHYYRENGIYNVKLIVKTNSGCYDTVSYPTKVLAKPTNLFTSNITESCAPACIEFYDYSRPNATSIIMRKWTLGEGDTTLEENPSKCYENLSNTDDLSFDIGLITTNDLGCSDSNFVEKYIWAWHNPVADFEANPELANMYESEISFENSSIGATYYSWDFGDFHFDNEEFPIHIYGDTGTYAIQLAVETDHACFDTTYREVRIDPVISIYTPNTFTPDGDGINDQFFFKSYGIEEEGLEFSIFDRWGNRIYYTTNFRPWDGTYKGKKVQEDTYIYKIRCLDFFGVEKEFTGHVNVLR